MVAAPIHRRNTTYVAAAFYLLSLPFLILVSIGNTYVNGTLNSIYFFKLDVSQIIPISVSNSNLLNSVARSLGLHDFYSVGLWSFCEGYLGDELLAGASIALPSEVTTILKLLRLGSHIMYAFYTAGTVVNFVLMFVTPLVLRTRWFSLAISLLAFVSAILITVASVISTAITVVAKIALTAQDELNISADIGVKMFVFMWLATIFTDLAFILHSAMGCCCKPDRHAAAAAAAASQNGSYEPSMREKGIIPLANFMKRRKGGSAAGDGNE
ncbi:SUR7/PalI family [Geosmithia morbida]|uniref:SUR7/PalI family n=1 Tax=Geosmithia morbida TaxID=1094350 RepID=A0A9P5D7F3_9HYPO|nr:SUR7/PalI family [Geosmithia morbida]KAF4125735.1 SUR7/PalI family [Geosmithia morbida]